MGICLTFVTSHCKCPSLRYGQIIWRMKAIITACRKWIVHLYPIVVYPSAVPLITTAVWWGSCCSVFCELCTNFLTVVSLVVHCVLSSPLNLLLNLLCYRVIYTQLVHTFIKKSIGESRYFLQKTKALRQQNVIIELDSNAKSGYKLIKSVLTG